MYEEKLAMKILLVTSVFPPHIGGVESYVYNLACKFAATGNQVRVIDASRFVKKYSEEKSNCFEILHIPVLYVKGMTYLHKNKYRKILYKELERADVVHLNDIKFIYKLLAKKKQKYGYKLFLSSHGFIFHTKSFLLLKKLHMKKMSKYSEFYDKNYCVSQQDLGIAKSFGFKNTELLLPGTNTHKFDFIDSEKYEENYLLYWGRIAPNKGLIELINSFNSLPFGYTLKIIGGGDDKEYINSVQELAGKNSSIEYCGYKTDKELEEYVKKAEFIVFPSLHEGFGMALVEALSSGKKVIANKIPTFIEILTDCNMENCIFDFLGEKSLENKITEIRKSETKKTNLEKFSVEFMVERLLQDYANSKSGKDIWIRG